MVNFQTSGPAATLAAPASALELPPPDTLPAEFVRPRVMVATHATVSTRHERTIPAAGRRRRSRVPAARVNATATSSRPSLFVLRFTSRELPLVSDSTFAAASDADRRSRASGATDSGPSSAIRRAARMSALASDQRAIRGYTGHRPLTASCNSASRKRSHVMLDGRHAMTRSTSAETRGTRRSPSVANTPDAARRAYAWRGTRSLRS